MRDKTIGDFLDSPDGAGKVLSHARLLLRLERIYQQIAPAHLCQVSRLVNYRSGNIIVHAANGATAVKLRQMAVTLADGFSRRGIECCGIQVKVGMNEAPAPSEISRQKPLSAQTFQTLGGLRDALPDSPLRHAVDTLIRKSAGVKTVDTF
jgi:hypothetical protein